MLLASYEKIYIFSHVFHCKADNSHVDLLVGKVLKFDLELVVVAARAFKSSKWLKSK